MSDVFHFKGCYGTTPTGAPNAQPSLSANVLVQASLARKVLSDHELTSDSPLSVPFSGLTDAGVVIVHVVGGKVRLRLTSADGASQAVPCDDLAFVVSRTVPFTALDITRVAGIPVTVTVFLGEVA